MECFFPSFTTWFEHLGTAKRLHRGVLQFATPHWIGLSNQKVILPCSTSGETPKNSSHYSKYQKVHRYTVLLGCICRSRNVRFFYSLIHPSPSSSIWKAKSVFTLPSANQCLKTCTMRWVVVRWPLRNNGTESTIRPFITLRSQAKLDVVYHRLLASERSLHH